MKKILHKKVDWLGKCALCKKEHSLCKCGLMKDMYGDGMQTDNLSMAEGTPHIPKGGPPASKP